MTTNYLYINCNILSIVIFFSKKRKKYRFLLTFSSFFSTILTGTFYISQISKPWDSLLKKLFFRKGNIYDEKHIYAKKRRRKTYLVCD